MKISSFFGSLIVFLLAFMVVHLGKEWGGVFLDED